MFASFLPLEKSLVDVFPGFLHGPAVDFCQVSNSSEHGGFSQGHGSANVLDSVASGAESFQAHEFLNVGSIVVLPLLVSLQLDFLM